MSISLHFASCLIDLSELLRWYLFDTTFIWGSNIHSCMWRSNSDKTALHSQDNQIKTECLDWIRDLFDYDKFNCIVWPKSWIQFRWSIYVCWSTPLADLMKLDIDVFVCYLALEVLLLARQLFRLRHMMTSSIHTSVWSSRFHHWRLFPISCCWVKLRFSMRLFRLHFHYY